MHPNIKVLGLATITCVLLWILTDIIHEIEDFTELKELASIIDKIVELIFWN